MERQHHQITRITEEQIPSAGKTLAEAFFTDALMLRVFSGAQERTDVLTWYCTESLHALTPSDGVYCNTGSVNGVAIWAPPGVKDEAPEWVGQAGADSYYRFLKVIGHLAPFRQAAMTGPFWYLSWLGVAPAWQGKGLGGALLAPVLHLADQQDLPCYLETFKDRNVSFYRQHGFEVVVNQIEPESDLPFWTMKRDPHSL